MKDYLLQRAKEPSTWRGLVLIATSAGCVITPAMADAIVALGIGLAGVIGVVTADKKTDNSETTAQG
jgi:hypothetical protein